MSPAARVADAVSLYPPPSHPPAGIQLAGLPDPVPEILSHHRAGRIKLVAIGIAALASTIYALDYINLPEGWFYLVAGWMIFLTMLGNTYVKSLRRQPHVDSLLDLLLEKGWKTAKLILLAIAVWGGYDLLHRVPPLRVALDSWERLLDLPLTLRSGRINLVQAACLYPWLEPLLETLRTAGQAHEFAAQLAPRTERRIARHMRAARRLDAAGESRQARAMLTEASEWLAGLNGYASDAGIIYHRRLLRRKLDAALGLAAPEGALDDSPREAAGRGDSAGTLDFEDLFGAVSATAGAAPGGRSPARQGGGQASHGYEEYREFVRSLREQSTVSWADVAGLDEVVGELKTILALGLARTPAGVKLESPRRILLYGPPGTGKTLLTAALSHGFDAPFYNIKVSDVLSKFFGESTRLLSALFEIVSREGPAVLFFDEIDSISGNREAGNMDGEERRMISALLAQLDGLKGKGHATPLFTIAATNIPWQLDTAILSRFEKQFYIPLPGEEARRRILDLHLARRGFTLDAPLDKLIETTRGYSGRELSQLCQEAVRLMLADANPRMEELAGQGQQAMSQYTLIIKPIGAPHLCAAFKRIRPQNDPRQLDRYLEWQRRAP